MSELKAYPEYKDSGVKWLRSIPKEWKIVKLKYLCHITTGSRDTQDKVENGSYPFFVRSDKIEKINEYSNNEEAVMTAGDGVGVGKVFHYYNGKFSAHQRVYLFTKFINSIGKFVYYYLSSNLIFEVMQGTAKSTVDSLRRNMLTEFPVSLPDKETQVNIIDFIDEKTFQIDSLISDKERLIELLEEKRQAVITETVTKGLDPNVKMKDSGVEGIGEVPEHWDVKRLKYLCTLNPSKSEVDKNSNLLATFVPMENLKSTGEIDYTSTRKISEVYSGYTYFKNKDIIMAKVTPCFENGNIAVADDLENGIGFGTTELHILRANNEINRYFLYYILQSEPFKQEGISSMYGVAGLKRIPTRFVIDYKIGLPSLGEQEEILEYIFKVNDEINEAVQSQKEIIQKLKEYRESLIYEAVTGKIDVRNYATKKEPTY